MLGLFLHFTLRRHAAVEVFTNINLADFTNFLIVFFIAGKTQCINHFIINDSWYLVDLPGYGYTTALNPLDVPFFISKFLNHVDEHI
jgi:hypothetical protein